MRGKTFPDRIEVYLKPEEIIFAPAPANIKGALKKSGIAIGSLIGWFAWAWMQYKHPKIIKGKQRHTQELTWDGEKFIVVFKEDIPA
jgi:hypothetical protein